MSYKLENGYLSIPNGYTFHLDEVRSVEEFTCGSRKETWVHFKGSGGVEVTEELTKAELMDMLTGWRSDEHARRCRDSVYPRAEVRMDARMDVLEDDLRAAKRDAVRIRQRLDLLEDRSHSHALSARPPRRGGFEDGLVLGAGAMALIAAALRALL